MTLTDTLLLVLIGVALTIGKRIMPTLEELNTKLTTLGTTLDEISGDLQELKDLVDATEEVPQEVIDAVDALVAKATDIAAVVPEPES